jgi:hypothetical protein
MGFSQAALQKYYSKRKKLGGADIAEVLAADYADGLTAGFSEWLMGMPAGWTKIGSGRSAMQLYPESPNGSVNGSRRRSKRRR